MQIIIEMPDAVYQSIKDHKYLNEHGVIREIVLNGTILPKGHGRLITEPTKEEIAKTIGGVNDFADCIRDCTKTVFNNAPTIIEADKSAIEDAIIEEAEEYEADLDN